MDVKYPRLDYMEDICVCESATLQSTCFKSTKNIYINACAHYFTPCPFDLYTQQ